MGDERAGKPAAPGRGPFWTSPWCAAADCREAFGRGTQMAIIQPPPTAGNAILRSDKECKERGNSPANPIAGNAL